MQTYKKVKIVGMSGEILSIFRSESVPRKAEFHFLDGKCSKFSACGGQHHESHDSFRFGENFDFFVGMSKTLK